LADDEEDAGGAVVCPLQVHPRFVLLQHEGTCSPCENALQLTTVLKIGVSILERITAPEW
jgi:hypothetical protein